VPALLLGTVFYTLDQQIRERPTFARQTNDCLICRGGSHTRGVPGHIVLSVYADRTGQPLFSAGSHRVDDKTSLVRCLLFSAAPDFPAPIEGPTTFAEEFSKNGPTDGQGRSLRMFDLKARLFRHPCSFLIYSKVFDALPEELRRRFWEKMRAVLQGEDRDGKYSHLSPADRSAVREILLATKPEAARTLGGQGSQP